jgi:hypothetical protein
MNTITIESVLGAMSVHQRVVCLEKCKCHHISLHKTALHAHEIIIIHRLVNEYQLTYYNSADETDIEYHFVSQNFFLDTRNSDYLYFLDTNKFHCHLDIWNENSWVQLCQIITR